VARTGELSLSYARLTAGQVTSLQVCMHVHPTLLGALEVTNTCGALQIDVLLLLLLTACYKLAN